MATYSPLVIGVFPKESDAKHAINALRDAGFDRSQIGLALREGGIVTTSLLDDLMKLGVPRDRAGYYDAEYRAGRAIVSVSANGREHEAMDILRRYSAYGLEVPSAGTTTTTGSSATESRQYSNVGEEGPRAMRLREEELQAEKQRVRTGEVRVRKEVVTEEQSINVPVTHEEVYIEHRPVAREEVSDVPVGQGEVIRVPVSEEQVRVTKRPVVTGEVIVGKREVEENVQYTDTVQREEAHLEREGRPPVRTNDPGKISVDDKTRARRDEEA